jgi:hypothetical protein
MWYEWLLPPLEGVKRRLYLEPHLREDTIEP